mmetsp:Transcript_41993/g.67512  ORF Transcript_41993/g.67512 Transcript_41993/m.67512 type:complete len:210 (-) Transcript_41993:246-875(-)
MRRLLHFPLLFYLFNFDSHTLCLVCASLLSRLCLSSVVLFSFFCLAIRFHLPPCLLSLLALLLLFPFLQSCGLFFCLLFFCHCCRLLRLALLLFFLLLSLLICNLTSLYYSCVCRCFFCCSRLCVGFRRCCCRPQRIETFSYFLRLARSLCCLCCCFCLYFRCCRRLHFGSCCCCRLLQDIETFLLFLQLARRVYCHPLFHLYCCSSCC